MLLLYCFQLSSRLNWEFISENDAKIKNLPENKLILKCKQEFNEKNCHPFYSWEIIYDNLLLFLYEYFWTKCSTHIFLFGTIFLFFCCFLVNMPLLVCLVLRRIFSWVSNHQEPILALLQPWYTNSELNGRKDTLNTFVHICNLYKFAFVHMQEYLIFYIHDIPTVLRTGHWPRS